MNRPATIALMLAASHLAVASAPCPGVGSGRPAASPPAATESETEHAHHAGTTGEPGRMPCHEAPAHVLRAACHCGCGGGPPGQEPVRSALAKALFAPAAPALEAPAGVSLAAAAPRPPPAPPSRIEHVPIAA